MASLPSRQASTSTFLIDSSCDIDDLLASVSWKQPTSYGNSASVLPTLYSIPPPPPPPAQSTSTTPTATGHTMKRIAGKMRANVSISSGGANEDAFSTSPTCVHSSPSNCKYESKDLGQTGLLPPAPPPLATHPDIAVAAEESRDTDCGTVSQETLRKCRNVEICKLSFGFGLMPLCNW